jgi:hypothetical protein
MEKHRGEPARAKGQEENSFPPQTEMVPVSFEDFEGYMLEK